MNLFDFSGFEPFNRMRQSMGTDALGHFELFDPNLHLTGDERSVLARRGMTVNRRQLGRLLDHCLCFKNSRVILVQDSVLHLADCPALPTTAQVSIGTSMRPFDTATTVCRDCLQQLTYQGYDEQKARKDRYNASVADRFSLEAFWRQYPPYPLKMDRELVKPLQE